MPDSKEKTPHEFEEETVSLTERNEIDDFTQKLLDKQTEYLLFPDVDEEDITTSSLEGSLSGEQRRIAEETMLSALDQMRRDRGQSTIEEEESEYARNHSRSSSSRRKSGKSAKSSKRRDAKREGKKESEHADLEPGRYERHEDTSETSRLPEEGKTEKKFYQKTGFRIGLVIVLILGVLFGAYVWKVTVYNPAHVATSVQDEAYKRLVKYADEFSMMSDAQKRGLTELEADYNSLPAARKTEIDDYFKNPKHTGKSFSELLAEMKESSLAADNPAFDELLSFAQGYNSASEEVHSQIMTKIDAYNALDQEAKDKIDEAMKQTTGKTFVQIYQEYKESHAAQSSQSSQESSQQEPGGSEQTPPAADQSQIQADLAQLQADRDNYAAFLADEGLPDDEVLAQYDAQIAELQAQLGQ